MYFPCDKTFKFGTLTGLQGTSTQYLTLLFCGTPKPTTTIVTGNMVAMEGTGGATHSFPSGVRFPYTGFDLSAFVGTVPVIQMTEGDFANWYREIGLLQCPGDCFKFGTSLASGPTDVTMNEVTATTADASTGSPIDSYIGFGLYLNDTAFTGSMSNAAPNIYLHGSGIVHINTLMLERRGILQNPRNMPWRWHSGHQFLCQHLYRRTSLTPH